MKTAEEWVRAIRMVLQDTAHRPTRDWIEAEARAIAGVVQQIQADAQRLPPPDVPPGALLTENRFAEINALIEAARTPSVNSACEDCLSIAHEVLDERSRLVGLLRDLSSDDQTVRYNAGYAAGQTAGRDEGMRIICEAIEERIRSIRERVTVEPDETSRDYLMRQATAYDRLLEYLRTVVKMTGGQDNG